VRRDVRRSASAWIEWSNRHNPTTTHAQNHKSVGAMVQLRSDAAITVEGRPIQPNAPQVLIGLRWVTPDYFKTFRIPVIKGTTLKDDEAGEPTVVLNESAERILFAGESSVGRRVRPAPFGFSNGKEVPNP